MVVGPPSIRRLTYCIRDEPLKELKAWDAQVRAHHLVKPCEWLESSPHTVAGHRLFELHREQLPPERCPHLIRTRVLPHYCATWPTAHLFYARLTCDGVQELIEGKGLVLAQPEYSLNSEAYTLGISEQHLSAPEVKLSMVDLAIRAPQCPDMRILPVCLEPEGEMVLFLLRRVELAEYARNDRVEASASNRKAEEVDEAEVVHDEKDEFDREGVYAAKVAVALEEEAGLQAVDLLDQSPLLVFSRLLSDSSRPSASIPGLLIRNPAFYTTLEDGLQPDSYPSYSPTDSLISTGTLLRLCWARNGALGRATACIV